MSYEWINDRYVPVDGYAMTPLGNAVCSTTTRYTLAMVNSLPLREEPPEYVYCGYCQCDIGVEHATCTQCGAPLRKV